MPLPFGSLVVAAGICGTLSFASLAASLGTEYWFIIEMNPANASDAEDWSSHSGLWSVGEGEKMKAEDSATYSESEHGMHSAIVVVLPLSLVLMLFGGICGLVSSLARSPVLLARTATYFFLCSESRSSSFPRPISSTGADQSRRVQHQTRRPGKCVSIDASLSTRTTSNTLIILRREVELIGLQESEVMWLVRAGLKSPHSKVLTSCGQRAPQID